LSDIVDYLVINVSSPNTPGLRDLQNENMLEEIVMQVCAVSNSKPIFIKVAPDHFKTFQSGLITIMQKYKLSGIICGNTLATHAESKMLSDSDLPLLQKGGLSGQPIFENNLALVKSYSKTNHDLFIIGVGGIATSAQLLEYKNAGAQLFQLYSALVFKGPQVINEIITPLVKS
jgi:dihydroorotate dehydrogenase